MLEAFGEACAVDTGIQKRLNWEDGTVNQQAQSVEVVHLGPNG